MRTGTTTRRAGAVLQIENLAVRRGDVRVLDGVSWRVQRGEHWVVLGPNGCGKTSLLKSIFGLFSPSAGSLELLGRMYGRADWREVRRHVGLVSSALQASIPAAEPARDTVISGRYAQLDLWAACTPADVRAADALLARVGLRGKGDRPWAFLSQGERQRVLIARALMARPRLLVFDEPCAGLDPVARAHFIEAVDALARQRGAPTLVLVTHHVEEIAPAFTHALLLRGGRVVAAGPLATALRASTLAETFGAPLRLTRRHGRHTLQLAPADRRRRGALT